MHEERINDEEEFPGMRGDRSESQDTVVTLEETASKPMEEPSKAPLGTVSSKPSIGEKTKSRLRNFTFRNGSKRNRSEAEKNENEAANDTEEHEDVASKKPMVDTSKT